MTISGPAASSTMPRFVRWAFKWQRILFRCWKDQVPYNDSTYLAALKQRNSPLLAWLHA
jgi:hypothetical protein